MNLKPPFLGVPFCTICTFLAWNTFAAVEGIDVSLKNKKPFTLIVANSHGNILLSGGGQEEKIAFLLDNNGNDSIKFQAEILEDKIRVKVVYPQHGVTSHWRTPSQHQTPDSGKMLSSASLSANLKIIVPSKLLSHYQLITEVGEVTVSNLSQNPPKISRIGVIQKGELSILTSSTQDKNITTSTEMSSTECFAELVRNLFAE